MGRNRKQGTKNLVLQINQGRFTRFVIGEDERVYNVQPVIAPKIRERLIAQGYTVRDESPAPAEGV